MIGVDVSALQAAIMGHTTSSTISLPAGLALARDSARESEIDSLLAGLPEGSLPEEPYSLRTEITRSGSPLKYEMPKERLRAWLGGTWQGGYPSFWEGRIYRDGSSWGVVYQDLPKKYTFSPPTLYWNNFFSTGGQGLTDNVSLTLDEDTGKLSWAIGSQSGASRRNFASQITISPSALQTSGSKNFAQEAIIEPGTHEGTFYGVPGTFYCAASATVGNKCQAVGDGTKGWSINFAGDQSTGSFTFTPDDGPSAFGGQIQGKPSGPQRPPHFYFGYWLNAPENDGGAWSIEPFAVANFYEDPISDLSSLSGTAKYSGPATGVYAVPDQLGHKGVTGTFYAHAVLTATWGSSSPTVTGTVGNFQSLTEDQHLTYIRDWSLSLSNVTSATQGSGPGSPQLGTWQRTFWGQDPADSNAPTAITGTFTGYFTNDILLSGKAHGEGSVVGAFVAEKVPE